VPEPRHRAKDVPATHIPLACGFEDRAPTRHPPRSRAAETFSPTRPDEWRAGNEKTEMNDVTGTETRILELLRPKVKSETDLSRDTNIVADTGLDSVSVMDFVLELEDAFDINIPLDRIAEVKTVADLARAVDELGGKG
jgi:acyl carrier protein